MINGKLYSVKLKIAVSTAQAPPTAPPGGPTNSHGFLWAVAYCRQPASTVFYELTGPAYTISAQTT
jgi:hypothetical protein